MEKKFFQKPTTYVGEVSINVTNLKNSLDFYQRIFGFQIVEQTDRRIALSADGIHPILVLEQPENIQPKRGRTTGLYHFAILLPRRADLANFLQHLVETEGQTLRLGASDHYVSEALYFDDPDGNGIEVAADKPSSSWSWDNGTVDMATVALDANGLMAERDKAWDGLPKDTVMGHIHLHVADLEETENFYVNGLGFDIVTRYPGALFASTGGYHHHLGLNVWNGVGAPAPAKDTVGLNYYTLVLADEETRQEKIASLQRVGAEVNSESNYYVVKDPAGNTIQLRVSE
ncbi:VOC family protein [Ornithinibacillus halotolerans]|uniref:Glyoxalase n=1 Tax=Ornithinibacillus halotolerans TaxID=1274357 RepID=A0A916RZJ3_9BACI|nr:VOC family protein [Ornithinibacillus halotolerans]GGA78164.1 glyoxalase [Ornithinibacillus halotolerans]